MPSSNHLRIQAYVMRALEEYQRTFGINPLPAKTEVLPETSPSQQHIV